MAKAVATVEDFERLANEMGLVPMTFLADTITEVKGDIRGYAPYTALRMYNDGLAEPTNKTLRAKPVETQAPDETDDERRRSAIDIADAIDDEHHLKRISLAKQISGSDASITAAQADEIIATEKARRVARADLGPNALTSQDTVTR